jgi:ribosomal protein L22
MSEEQKRIEDAAAETTDTEPKEAEEAKQAVAQEKAEESAEATEPKADAAEEKPKRTRRKKAAPKEEEEQPQAKEAAEAEAEEPAAEEEAPEEEKPARRRRGSAETTAAAEKKPAPRRAPDGTVRVRAQARYVRTAPRKARLVIQHIRGKQVDDARAILRHTPRGASRDILKLLDSAIANAENNHDLVADDLLVAHAYVDEGPTLKRYRPRALGRATRIRKRTSHMTIELAAKE